MKQLLLIGILCASGAFAHESQIPVSGIPNAYCQVRTYMEHSGSGGRCYFDEVMVGLDSADPVRIRCARLDVTCTQTEKTDIIIAD